MVYKLYLDYANKIIVRPGPQKLFIYVGFFLMSEYATLEIKTKNNY